MKTKTKLKPTLPVTGRIALLRDYMKKHRIDAVIVPTADPHMTEYLPIHWRFRAWLSGFEGSAGTIVVTANDAALWSDSRYWIEGAAAVNGTGITFLKAGKPDTPAVADWLKKKLKKGQTVVFDPDMVGVKEFDAKAKEFADAGITLKTAPGLCAAVWQGRPAAPAGKVVDYPVKYAGEKRADKLKRLRDVMKEKKADAHLITSSYDTAWLFNLRGADTPHTPIFASFALITPKEAFLFADITKFSYALSTKLAADGIVLKPYADVAAALKSLKANTAILLHPGQTVKTLADAIPSKCKRIDTDILPTAHMKAVKNDTEIECFHHAMIQDGIALTTFFASVEEYVKNGVEITEFDACEMMEKIRGLYSLGLSFATIAGYNANAALCHYRAAPGTAKTLEPKGVFLVDSGSQYYGATTDITRTVALGPVTKEMKTDYTRVLKGHLRLSRAIFPDTVTGAQLDTLAREDIWQGGLDFFHGTGHGIGAYLNVHEGPHGVGTGIVPNPVKIKAGMLITNEPGVYRENAHGIRIENILLAIPHTKTPFGNFLRFETLTLFPYDKNLIDKSLLDEVETAQINIYHQRVFKLISPKLSPLLKQWLKNKTTPL